MTPRFCACNCGASLDGMRADALYYSEACKKRAERARSRDKAGTEHPLADARTAQATSKLNRDLGALIRGAIIRRLSEPPYRVHADDLEGDFPAEHVARCRKLVPAQLGGLAGAGHIRDVERRKSAVPSRKGAKSFVYEFTISGRRKLLAGVGAGKPVSSAQDAGPGVQTDASVDPGERSGGIAGDEPAAPESVRLFDPAPERPLHPLTDVEAA